MQNVIKNAYLNLKAFYLFWKAIIRNPLDLVVVVPIYLCVSEEEGGVCVLDPGVVIQLLQVIVELGVAIASTQLNLYTFVGADVGGQPRGKYS